MNTLRNRPPGAAMRRRCFAILIASLPLAALAAPSAAGTEPVTVACGQVITEDIRLKADLICAGDGVTLQGDLVFDLRGHRITATGGSAITVVGDGSPTIERGRITDSQTGLAFALEDTDEFLPARSVTVTNVTFARNRIGIAAPHTGGPSRRVTETTVVKSRFQANTQGIRGGGPVTVRRSSFTNNVAAIRIDVGEVTVSRSHFADNNGAISCLEANQCRISDSRLVNNTVGISSGGYSLRIERTKISGSQTAVSAVLVHPVLTDNLIYDNTTGVHLYYAEGTLTGNRFLRNRTGFTATHAYEWGGATLTQNTFVDNGDGIFTESGNVRLGRNLAVHNERWGIYAPNATDLGGNRARANGQSPQCVGVICT